jgi:hypothetical protein
MSSERPSLRVSPAGYHLCDDLMPPCATVDIIRQIQFKVMS